MEVYVEPSGSSKIIKDFFSTAFDVAFRRMSVSFAHCIIVDGRSCLMG